MSILHCFLKYGLVSCLPTFKYLFKLRCSCALPPHCHVSQSHRRKENLLKLFFFLSFFPVEPQYGVKSSQHAVLHTLPICAGCFMNYLRTEEAEAQLSVCGNMKLNSTAVQKPPWFQLLNKLLLNL